MCANGVDVALLRSCALALLQLSTRRQLPLKQSCWRFIIVSEGLKGRQKDQEGSGNQDTRTDKSNEKNEETRIEKGA